MGRHEADKPEVSTLWFHCLCPAHLCPSVFLANEAYYVCVPQSVFLPYLGHQVRRRPLLHALLQCPPEWCPCVHPSDAFPRVLRRVHQEPSLQQTSFPQELRGDSTETGVLLRMQKLFIMHFR